MTRIRYGVRRAWWKVMSEVCEEGRLPGKRLEDAVGGMCGDKGYFLLWLGVEAGIVRSKFAVVRWGKMWVMFLGENSVR